MQALELAHANGLIHCGIDLETIFLTQQGDLMIGGWEKAFICDEQVPVNCGKVEDYLSYASSPEMAKIYGKQNGKDYGEGAPDSFNNKTDIWSSGCILHLLLSDDLKQPFTDSDDIYDYKNE